MKYILFLFLNAICFLSFCQSDTLTKEDIGDMFHEINKTDQTYIGENIRDTQFVKNFNQIINLIKVQGYPKFFDNNENKKLNRSIENGTKRTFVHILQTKPELLLNTEIIDIISKEISEQRINSEIMKFALSIYQYDMDVGRIDYWSESIEKNFYLAIQKWDIKLYNVKKK
ncbi:hypothetical protein [Crocinitomix algicola]|uniref:hypothetical protein n=1 Tax=Crocinitomix algicola TaxID=1740263 RepID=UPI001112DBAA|nr:hypothetical protein [Crocinitomix algicola]